MLQNNTVIPYGHQQITEDDISAVIETLKSDWLTQGPIISKFETALANYTGAHYVIAVANATAALHIACITLGLGKGDWLWTTPNTFVASANCGLYCGANVDFVDIDPLTLNISIRALEQKLIKAEKIGKLPKIIVPVDFAGQSCDMRAIRRLADRYGFYIIEDASHAIGGCYQNERIGNSKYADIVVFSFHPVKIITTGEGGALMTNSSEVAEKLKLYRTHGITKDPTKMHNNSDDSWYYEQIALGYNYRITDIQCALGIEQLKRVDNYVARRNEIATIYNNKLQKLPLILPFIADDCYSAFHLYVIQLDSQKTDKARKEVFQLLRNKHIGVNVHYIPVHLQPYYSENFDFKWGDFPNAENYYRRTITLPLYPALTEVQIDYIVDILCEILK